MWCSRASRVVLLGGEAALSPAVAESLAAAGVEVERVAGANRMETAAAIASRLPASEEVLLAEATAWADALSAASLAANQGLPILLTGGEALPATTAAAIGADTTVTIVGGTGVVSAQVEAQVAQVAGGVRRLSGPTRYATAVAVADDALARGVSPETLWLATGRNWPDALSAGSAPGMLLLIDGQSAQGSPQSSAWIAAQDGIRRMLIAGGESAVATATIDQLTEAR